MPRYYSLMRRVPRPAIETVYRGLEAMDVVSAAVYNHRHKTELPLPPMRLRARIGSRGRKEFLDAGRRCAGALRNAARTHLGVELTEAGRILDFGCGCGRTLRHFDWTAIEGCDVDAAAIAWMQENAGPERFAANRFEPPLPWCEASFDLVYSVSVFTHLNERSQAAWLREISRVLKPGAAALLTIQGEHAHSLFLNDTVYSTASMKSRLVARGPLVTNGGFIFEPYDVAIEGVAGEYGLAFQTDGCTGDRWSEWFDVIGFDKGSVDGLQDVVAMRKKSE